MCVEAILNVSFIFSYVKEVYMFLITLTYMLLIRPVTDRIRIKICGICDWE